MQGLASSTTYGVKVKARNEDGDETALSAEGQGTTSAGAPPTTRTVAIYPSTASPPGGYDATYTSMSAMQAGESKDLVALNRFLRVEIVNSDGNWSTPDTSVIFDGWTTDRSAGQYLEIEVMSGARNSYTDGKWSTSHYRLSSTAHTLVIDNDAAAGNYLEADFIGLQVENTGGGNLAAQIKDGAYHKTIKFIASHFRGTTDFEVLQLSDDGTAEVWFINTILENSNISNSDEIVRATSAWSATAYFYNCTVVGGGLEGLDVDTGTVTVKNCAVFNNDGTDVLAGGVTPDFNASDDSIGTNWVDISPAVEVDGWNAAVTDYANGDYRVKDASSVLYQAGLSQTADSNVPSEDIAGNVRPTGSNPVSIGAFEAGASNPIAHWTLDEGTGDTAADSSGNGNDGTLGNSPSPDANDPSWTCVAGGNALLFDGADDYVNVGDSASLNFGTGDFSVAVWVKSSQAQVFDTWPKLVEKWTNSPSSQGYRLMSYQSTDSPNPAFGIFNGGTGEMVESTVNIRDGLWHHVVGVKTSTQLKIYIDGSLSGTPASHSLGTTSNSADLAFGKSLLFSDDEFEGNMDDVRIYNSALSAGEISTLYASPPTDCGAADLQQLHYRWRNDDGGESGGLDTGTGADGPVRRTGC